LMCIQIQFITLMGIRILPCNVMRIHETLLFLQSSEMKKYSRLRYCTISGGSGLSRLQVN
jgi:hypothetical protein